MWLPSSWIMSVFSAWPTVLMKFDVASSGVFMPSNDKTPCRCLARNVALTQNATTEMMAIAVSINTAKWRAIIGVPPLLVELGSKAQAACV